MRPLFALLVAAVAAAFPLIFPASAAADDAADVKAAFYDGEMLLIKGDFDGYRAKLLGKQYLIDNIVVRRQEKMLGWDVYDAAAARFPGEKILIGTPRRPASDYEAALQRDMSTVQVTVNGNEATLSQPAPKAAKHMRRVEGVWKQVVEVNANGEKNLREDTAMNEDRITAYREALEAMKAGKYKSAEEARMAFHGRIFKMGQERQAAEEKKSQKPATPAKKPPAGAPGSTPAKPAGAGK
jgi:hypothetical protein